MTVALYAPAGGLDQGIRDPARNYPHRHDRQSRKAYDDKIAGGLLPQRRMGRAATWRRRYGRLPTAADYSTGQILNVDGGFQSRVNVGLPDHEEIRVLLMIAALFDLDDLRRHDVDVVGFRHLVLERAHQAIGAGTSPVN